MDLEWLEDFITVVRTKSFTQAAVARKCTQPTLTRRIRSLEDWVGAQLLNRDVSPVGPTTAGNAFLEYAKNVVREIAEARDRARSFDSGNSLRLYTLHTLAATFVPVVIAKFRRLAPDDEFKIKVSISVGTISDCVEAVAYGAAPLMISYESREYPINFPGDVPDNNIQRVTIENDELILVCPRGQADQYEDQIKRKKPVRYLAYSTGTYLSNLVTNKIEQERLSVTQIDDAQMADTLRNLARADQGMAWVLRSTAMNALEENEISEVDIPDLRIPLEIKLFRSTSYELNDEQRITVQRVWTAAKSLEESLKERTPKTSVKSSRTRVRGG